MTVPHDESTSAKTGTISSGGASWAVRKMRLLIDAPVPAESPALLDAVRDIGTFYDGNTASARRALQSQLHRRAVQRSMDVIEAFQSAQQCLQDVQSQITAMENDIASLSTRLTGARDGASVVVAQTSDLRAKLSASEKRQRVCSAFAKRFVLTKEEEESLAGVEVDATFLTALARLEKIHDESRALLRSRNQRAGLEALELAATTREEAYEKVFKYVQAHCGTLDVDAEEREEDAALLREAIRALRARPMLLRYCAEEVGSARRASLVARFVAALTKGGPGGMPRPIEMHAHDPMRYTNDMLAWIHQALASEKELTNRLFTADQGNVDERTKAHNDELALKVLNTVFDALCRPFRIRFEQALEQQLPVVVLYKLASLLEFYANTMSQLLGPAAALPEMLMECNSIAMYGFFSAWKSKMESFRLSGVGPSEDLTPPAAVNQSMTRLDEIMATLDASLTPEDARQGQITAVLEVILNPLLALCQSMSSKSLSPVEQSVFLANCIESMRIPLVAYSFASARVQQLTAASDSNIDEYINLASTIVLRRCGLADRVRILKEHAADVEKSKSHDDDGSRKRVKPLSSVPGMDAEALSISIKNFYAMLFGGTMVGSLEALQPPAVSKIINVRARNRAKTAVAESLAKAHRDIYDAVLNPDNRYGPDAVAAVGLRDPQKVELILTNGYTR